MPRSQNAVQENKHPAHVCVVYDPKTGRVAHVHEFFGENLKSEECERAALDTVASLGREKAAGLKVLHPRELKHGPDKMLRVNPKTQEVVAEDWPIQRR